MCATSVLFVLELYKMCHLTELLKRKVTWHVCVIWSIIGFCAAQGSVLIRVVITLWTDHPSVLLNRLISSTKASMVLKCCKVCNHSLPESLIDPALGTLDFSCDMSTESDLNSTQCWGLAKDQMSFLFVQKAWRKQVSIWLAWNQLQCGQRKRIEKHENSWSKMLLGLQLCLFCVTMNRLSRLIGGVVCTVAPVWDVIFCIHKSACMLS